MNRRHLIRKSLLCLVLCCAAADHGIAGDTQDRIPFPEALGRANVVQEDIPDVLENALILGNGDINALVHTDGGKLVVRLSKNDVGDWRNDTASDNTLVPWKTIRELGSQGKMNGGGNPNMGWNRNPFPAPISCGKLTIDLGEVEKTPAVLDLEKAVARIGTSVASATTPVAVRSLTDRNVFLIEGGGAMAVESHRVPHLDRAEAGQIGEIRTLYQELPASIDWPGMTYAVAIAEGERRKAIAVVTSFDAEDPLETAVRMARRTLREADAAIRAHENDWADFWSAGGVRLADPALEAAWYRNLYFLRCVTKANTAKAGLFAGVRGDGVVDWHGGHTMNYNCQQSVWAAYATNHVDLADSYRWLITRYMDNAEWLCRQLFDFKGVYFPHNLITYQADHATSGQPLGGVHIHIPWGYSVGMTGWAVQNLWWQYQYAPDERFLRQTAYPALKQAAIFYANFIDTCDERPDGKVLFGPSVSPEHFGLNADLRMNWNETNGLVFARFALRAAIEAAMILRTDGNLVRRWRESLDRLPPFETAGTPGSEVVVAVKGAGPIVYNCPITAHPVFPGELVTWFSPEPEKALMTRTLASLRTNGNNSLMTVAIARARMSLPDAYALTVQEFESRSRPNGTITLNRRGGRFNGFGHYVEQFAAPAAVSELLLQSVGRIVRLFPAWPEDKDAAFEQLRAKGGFLVSATRSQGEVRQVKVVSTAGGEYAMVGPWPATAVQREGEVRTLKGDARNIIRLDTRPGETFVFTQAIE